MQLVDSGLVQLLDLIARDSRAGLTRRNVLNGENVAGAAAYQLHAFAGQVAHLTVLRRQNGAGRQDAQAQQVGKVARVGLVTAVLEPVVFLDRGGVGQMDDEAGGLQASFGRRFFATTRSVSSITLTTLLFECRSMPL
jgi:hypothetical protein